MVYMLNYYNHSKMGLTIAKFCNIRPVSYHLADAKLFNY